MTTTTMDEPRGEFNFIFIRQKKIRRIKLLRNEYL